MYLSINKVKDELLKDEQPVFFFDTCSILDILNSIHLYGLSESYASNMLELIKINGKSCWLVSCQNVNEEWIDNIDAVLSTMEKEIKKLDRSISSTINVTNLVLNTNYSMPPKFSGLSISSKIKSLSESFLNSCRCIERTNDHTLKAMQRVRKLEAPARKGKLEPKDCEIVECFLELCQELRGAGFNEKIIFVTANKDDFGSHNDLKPPLDTQFSSHQALLINSVDHVLAIARGQT
ncbi:PIN domain-containing protein [Citrobacter europaeus]|uniref:PIN domain-containing protein n=1 Tax=Citrobacter europaeus TaxID=1914243 RepID=UPI0028BEC06E|nr:PIN domain-containing protein [Citrobacter europaeus]MDT7085162.1 PIN domain-containing protein [Citrobacter europaeus]